jgi:hypothetical protein
VSASQNNSVFGPAFWCSCRSEPGQDSSYGGLRLGGFERHQVFVRSTEIGFLRDSPQQLDFVTDLNRELVFEILESAALIVLKARFYEILEQVVIHEKGVGIDFMLGQKPIGKSWPIPTLKPDGAREPMSGGGRKNGLVGKEVHSFWAVETTMSQIKVLWLEPENNSGNPEQPSKPAARGGSGGPGRSSASPKGRHHGLRTPN